MPAGSLIAAYAYEVAPRQVAPFVGGIVRLTAQLESALDSTFDRSRVLSAPAVTFQVDTNYKASSIL